MADATITNNAVDPFLNPLLGADAATGDAVAVDDISAGETKSLTLGQLAIALSSVGIGDAELVALAGLVSAANKLPYFTGSGTASLVDFTAFARTILDDANAAAVLTTLGITAFIQTLLDDADAATARTTLGLAIGTNVQAWDADLDAIAALVSAADKLPYSTGAQAWALTTITAFARTLLDDADAATARTTLGVAIGTNVQAWDADLDAIAALASAANKLPYATGAQAWSLTDFTAAARALLDDADAAAMRVTLDVPSNAEAVLDTIIDAKGDIPVGTAADTISRLAVGTNGQVLTADSTAGTGLKWATPAGGGDLLSTNNLSDLANAATARTNLGLAIGTNVQAYDAELAALAGLVSAADKLPYFTGSGTAALADFSSTARALLDDVSVAAMATTLGLGTGSSPEFTAVNIGHATDTTITRESAGDLLVEGNHIYRAGGTDVAVADGGTGSSTAATARTALGVGNNDSPQFAGVNVGHASDTTITRESAGDLLVEGKHIYRADGTDVAVVDGGTGSSTAAGAATNLGLGTGDSPEFAGVNVGAATDTTITRVSAGDIAVEGKTIYRVDGTDVAVADGGTGASTAAGAATNLGLGTGDSPQFTGVNVGHASDTTITREGAGDVLVEGKHVYRADGTDVAVADGGTGASTAAAGLANLGGVDKNDFDAAGDILIGTGDNAYDNLAIGTVAGKAVVADPNAANKISIQFPQSADEASRGTTSSLASTFDRAMNAETNSAVLSTGRISLCRIFLPKGLTVTTISFCAMTTALSVGANQWFGLFDSSRNKLQVTGDDTSTAWAANTIKTLTLASPYVTTTAGWFYLGIMVKATTVPSLAGGIGSTAGNFRDTNPKFCGFGDTGLTNPASCPATVAALSQLGLMPYAEVA